MNWGLAMLVVVCITVQTGTLTRTSSVMILIDEKREILDNYNLEYLKRYCCISVKPYCPLQSCPSLNHIPKFSYSLLSSLITQPLLTFNLLMLKPVSK